MLRDDDAAAAAGAVAVAVSIAAAASSIITIKRKVNDVICKETERERGDE